MNESGEPIVAEFEDASARHRFLIGAGLCLVTVIGLPFLPIWLFGFGQWYARESVRRMHCALGPRSLEVRKGIIFRSQAHIPLDKVTDLKLYQGPLMRWLGIHGLKIETAGQGAPAQSGEGNLVGVVDAPAFRNRVIEQRDRVTALASSPTSEALAEVTILTEVRDTLLRIEAKLADR